MTNNDKMEHPDGEKFALALAGEIDSEHGEDIVALDVRGISGYTDFLLIATARNTPLARSLGNKLSALGKTSGNPLYASEGEETCEWLLLDFSDVVVHIFLPDARHYFDLEALWRDAPRLPLPERPGANPS